MVLLANIFSVIVAYDKATNKGKICDAGWCSKQKESENLKPAFKKKK